MKNRAARRAGLQRPKTVQEKIDAAFAAHGDAISAAAIIAILEADPVSSAALRQIDIDLANGIPAHDFADRLGLPDSLVHELFMVMRQAHRDGLPLGLALISLKRECTTTDLIAAAERQEREIAEVRAEVGS